MSGGVPRTVSQTGGQFFGLDDQAVQTVSAAGDIARQAGYGDEGARALQAVLLTEGGLTGARGDYGKSAGPLQFFRDKGMLPAFASYLGTNQDQAATYAEQHPLEAIKWAVGTNDKPGYLGAALKYGLQKGLAGADLATYVQANGQRSQSPERAGQWHNVLFADGQDPFSTAALTQRQTVAGGQWGTGDTTPGPGNDTLAPPPIAGRAADRQDRIDALNRPSQFGMGLSAGDALAACGPAAAIAFARAYGRNPTTDEAMQLAKAAGWDSQTGMKGVASEQALLGTLGVQTKLEQQVDWSHVGQEAANGNPVIVSTPGHYYTIDGVQEDPQGQQHFHVGTSGTDLKGGAEWMTAVDMQRLMGKAQGALYADHPLAGGPSIAESTKPAPVSPQQDSGLGGAFAAIGQKAQDVVQAVRNVNQGARENVPGVAGVEDYVGGGLAQVQPGTTPPTANQAPIDAVTAPLVAGGGAAMSALGTALHGAGELVGGPSQQFPSGGPLAGPYTGAARDVAGTDQQAREFEQKTGVSVRNFQAMYDRVDADPSLLPEVQRLEGIWNATVNKGGAVEAYGRAPASEQAQTEVLGSTVSGLLALPLSAEGAPLAAKIAAEFLQPGSNVGNVVKALGSERQVVSAAVDQVQKMPGGGLAPVRAQTPQSATDLLQSMIDAAKAKGADPDRLAALQREVDQLDPAAATRRGLAGSTAPATSIAPSPGPVVAADAAERAATVQPGVPRPDTYYAGSTEPSVTVTPQPAYDRYGVSVDQRLSAAEPKPTPANLPTFKEPPGTPTAAAIAEWQRQLQNIRSTPAFQQASPAEQTRMVAQAQGDFASEAKAARPTTTQATALASTENPFALLAEPGPGRVALSQEELDTHLENLNARYQANDERINVLENRLLGGGLGKNASTGGIERPSWAVGWSDEALTQFAKDNGFNPYDPTWGTYAVDAAKEAGYKGTGANKMSPTAARAELTQLRAEQEQLLAATEVPDGATTLYRSEPTSPTDLPWSDYNEPSHAPATRQPATSPPADVTGPARAGGDIGAPPAAPGRAGATGPLRAADGEARAAASPAVSQAAAGGRTLGQDQIDALAKTDQFKAARPIDQIEMLRALAEGRPPITGPVSTAAGTPATTTAASSSVGVFGQTELNAGLNPRNVQQAGARLFAPATQAPQPIQTALDTFDGQVRGAAARIDTMVGRGQLAQDTGNQLYAQTKAQGYGQFLKDVAQSPDGVLTKGAGVARPDGWKDGATYGAQLSQSWVSPETATVLENIRDQVNGTTLVDALNAVNKGFGLVKEATLGGSTYHLAQETMQVARITRQNAPGVLAQSLANAADPTGKLYQSFRTSSTWAPWFERSADAGITMTTRTPEGELVDLMRGPKGLAVRTGAGAGAGFVKGYLGESDPQKRFEAGLKDAGVGAAFGAFGSYMVPALWERAVPTMKVAAFRTLVEKGMSDTAAATMVNNGIGGENLVRIARSPLVQAASRAAVFAPDWWANWGRNVYRGLNPLDRSEVGMEAKKYVATAVVSGAVMVEGLNRVLAGHSALDNDRDHIADVDVTKLWGPDPKTGQRQYVNFLGPIADIINAGASGKPGDFLVRRAGYIPNIASELTGGKTLSGFTLPNVAAELRGQKTTTPVTSAPERVAQVATNQLEGMYPAGASSAQRMYERGGMSAAALSFLTGAREASERAPGGTTSSRPQPAQRPQRAVRPQ